MEPENTADLSHMFVDKDKLRRILGAMNAETGFVPVPGAAAEQSRAMALADGVDPGPVFTPERQEVVYRYSGPIYSSPAGRGIWLYGFEPERMLEDELPSGEYSAEIVVRLTPKPASPQP